VSKKRKNYELLIQDFDLLGESKARSQLLQKHALTHGTNEKTAEEIRNSNKSETDKSETDKSESTKKPSSTLSPNSPRSTISHTHFITQKIRRRRTQKIRRRRTQKIRRRKNKRKIH
jgi:hypothetical protein